MLRKGLFHCESRGVKQENSVDDPCFYVFTCFDGIIQLFQGSESSESQGEFEGKPYNEKITSSTVRSRRIPRGAVESVTISV